MKHKHGRKGGKGGDEKGKGKVEGKLKRKVYEKELRKLQGELCTLQEGVKVTGQRIMIVFEGRDAAGKGGTIKAITERVSPRVFRIVALPAPTEREKSQMYIQRYMAHFPAAGEVIIFDRSWYNRAGVEPVMGFCTKQQHRRFLELCPPVEKQIVDNGIILLKFWLEVGDAEQERRFNARIEDPVRQWKLSAMDLPSRERWYDYSRARDQMLDATDTDFAPWHIVRSDDKKRAPESDHASAEADSLRADIAQEGQTAQARYEARLRRRGDHGRAALDPGAVLIPKRSRSGAETVPVHLRQRAAGALSGFTGRGGDRKGRGWYRFAATHPARVSQAAARSGCPCDRPCSRVGRWPACPSGGHSQPLW
jgi:polyphosphate kinase 2